MTVASAPVATDETLPEGLDEPALTTPGRVPVPLVPPGAVGLSAYGAGRIVEAAACRRYDLVDVASDRATPTWADAFDRDGTPIECKACALRVRQGAYTGRGRWQISLPNHRQLIDAGGEYALGVYSPVGPRILALARLDPALVEARCPRLGADVERCHEDLAIKFPYTGIFDELDQQLEYVPWSAWRQSARGAVRRRETIVGIYKHSTALPPVQRADYIAVEGRGESQTARAHAREVTPATVSANLASARDQLRACLRSEGVADASL